MLDDLLDGQYLPEGLRHVLTTTLWCCGAAGVWQRQRLDAIARMAATEASLREMVERSLIAEYPLLPHLRERAVAGHYDDDRDVFTPLERDRLRFAAWLHATGRIDG